MPEWLAPNAITLLGFAAVVVNVLSIWIWDPSLNDGPRWLYFSCAAGLFFYQTMDNIDGKQARKTGTSSPLGELFDHGIDSLNCPLGGLVQCAAMGLGHSRYAFFCLFIACWTMYLSDWETFHTGTLFLGAFNGPVEGVIIACGILVWTGLKGPQWWARPLSSLGIPLLAPPNSFRIVDFMMAFAMFAFLVAHLPLCLRNVYKHLSTTRRQLSSSAAPKISQQEATMQLLPMFLFTLFAALWVFSPRSVILSGRHMVPFAFLVCFTFGQISSKIILAHLTKGPFPYSPMALLPYAIGAIGVNFPSRPISPRLEVLYLYLAAVFTAFSFLSTSLRIIAAFCDYLGISCLTIPHRGSEGRRRSNTSERERGAAGINVRRTASITNMSAFDQK